MSVRQKIPSLEEENLGSNYSKIISPEDYNTLMSLHLYINQSNQYIANYLHKNFAGKDIDVIDIGCGTGPVTQRIAKTNPNVSIYGIDVDEKFLSYARKNTDPRIKYIYSDVLSYKHPNLVHVISSGGFHHHISKQKVNQYLKKIYDNLCPGGVYLVCDEFISEYDYCVDNIYAASKGRDEALVIWYSHIIGSAIKSSEIESFSSKKRSLYKYLAIEESKTLLDDIYQARPETYVKTHQDIDFVMEAAPVIQQHIMTERLDFARQEAQKLLKTLEKNKNNTNIEDDDSVVLSRGDFKVPCSIFEIEAKNAGFIVENFKAFGLYPETVGNLGVYTLRKSIV